MSNQTQSNQYREDDGICATCGIKGWDVFVYLEGEVVCCAECGDEMFQRNHQTNIGEEE